MTPVPEHPPQIRAIVEGCLRAVLPPEAAMPRDDQDWVESGLLDSMAHVEVLMGLERAAKTADLFQRVGVEPPTTIRTAMAALEKVFAQPVPDTAAARASQHRHGDASQAALSGWGAALGSERIAIEQVEREFGLTAGKLSQGAGLEIICRASAKEDEVSLARVAAQQALQVAGGWRERP